MKAFSILLLLLFGKAYSQVQSSAYVNSGAMSRNMNCGIGEIFIRPVEAAERPAEITESVTEKKPEDKNLPTQNLIVSPNPTLGIVHIDTNFDINTVSVYSLEGKWIMNVNITKSKTVDLTDLPAGMYLLTCEPDPKSIKIIKQ